MSKTKPIFTTALVILILGLSLAACQAGTGTKQDDVLVQYSTLGSLMAGVYDGEMTFGELKEFGDFGLGTFNALDGEMIQVDHQIYQIKADGVAYLVDDKMKTPFSVVTYFDADQSIQLKEKITCEAFKDYLDDQLPTQNTAYAIKVMGSFEYMKTRSVPKQEKPYPLLSEVIETQPIFEFQSTDGIMIGFRLPVYMNIANAPGYHFHYLNNGRDAGGHVLDCIVQKATIEIDQMNEWYTIIPSDDEFYEVDFSQE
jgi:acetolactate decarboxylase